MLYPKHKLLRYKWGGLGNHDSSILCLTYFTEHMQFKIYFSSGLEIKKNQIFIGSFDG